MNLSMPGYEYELSIDRNYMCVLGLSTMGIISLKRHDLINVTCSINFN